MVRGVCSLVNTPTNRTLVNKSSQKIIFVSFQNILVFINNIMFWFCVMNVITYTLNDLGMSAVMLVTYNQFRGVYRALSNVY